MFLKVFEFVTLLFLLSVYADVRSKTFSKEEIKKMSRTKAVIESLVRLN